MKKAFVAALLIFVFCWAGCAFIQPSTQEKKSAEEQPFPAYSGLKAKVAVADFELRAAKVGSEAGAGLREMLAAALISSKRFFILERQPLGTAQQGQEPGVLASSDIIITVAVTEFEPQSSGGRSGVGGGGGVGSGALGGLLGASLNKSHLALEIRIVNASTLEALSTTKVQGQAADVSGLIGGGFLGGWALGPGLSAYANTPMEKAIRVCIIEAVRYISQAIPANFYKY